MQSYHKTPEVDTTGMAWSLRLSKVAGCAGSRDFTVKVWDARSGPSALFTLGVPQGDFTATTHLEMVTCVDVAGDIVVSGSLDQSIAAWDLRTLGHAKPLAVAGQTSVSWPLYKTAWLRLLKGILVSASEGRAC